MVLKYSAEMGKLIAVILVAACSAVWIVLGFKAFVLTISIFSLLMWLNITLATLGNVIIGRDVDINYDIFWKLLFIFFTSIGFGIYFNI